MITGLTAANAGLYAVSNDPVEDSRMESDKETYLVVLSGLDSEIIVSLQVLQQGDQKVLIRKVTLQGEAHPPEVLPPEESLRLLGVLRAIDWAYKPRPMPQNPSTRFPMRVLCRVSGPGFYHEIEAWTDVMPPLGKLVETIASFRPRPNQPPEPTAPSGCGSP
jgi:hypothetical protein